MATDESTPFEDFPLPNRKDRLFTSKPPKRGKAQGKLQGEAQPRFSAGALAMFASHYNRTWDARYREGWFLGGETLAMDMVRRAAIDSAVARHEFYGLYLPMLYCYRHFLEVSLKRLIGLLAPLSNLQVKLNLDAEHGLMQLWSEIRRQMSEACPPTDERADTDRNVERLINEFHQFDPSSQTFRYRRDKLGRPQEDSIPICDLEQFIQVMRGLRNYFGACRDLIWMVEQHRAEMQNDAPYDY